MSADDASWIGREQRVEDIVGTFPARALAAALGRAQLPGPGDPLPPFWHRLYALEVVAGDDTGPDGHPRLGLFLPPLALPRRMWAGGRLWFHRPLRIGDRIRRRSRIREITPKVGRSGRLVFILVEHRIEVAGALAVLEEQDIVYREARPLPAAPRGAGTRLDAVLRRRWVPDEVLLFRYSALTYNGHRIHYDQRYAREVEGYPDLVVHGPLLATFMLELLAEGWPGDELAEFRFRARAPLFVNRPLEVLAAAPDREGRIHLRVEGEDGVVAMDGIARLRRS